MHRPAKSFVRGRMGLAPGCHSAGCYAIQPAK